MQIRHWIKTNNRGKFDEICSILKEAGVEYEVKEIDNGYLLSFISDKPIQAISTRFYFIE